MYRSIGLGGGGTRGGLHIGALRAIQDVQGSLEFPDGIYGASVGAIIGTAVAFRIPLNDIHAAYDTHCTLSRVLPPLKLANLMELGERRGLFSMDSLTTLLLAIFDACGVDLRGKRMKDAPQKLFVVASNMTTGKPTLLTGDVPILDALRCSAAIPLVYEPQVLYGQVYLDAGVHLRCIRSVVPPDALVVHISGKTSVVTPESSLAEVLFACYGGKVSQYHGKNMIRIKDVSFGLLGELSADDRAYLVREGYSQTRKYFMERG